MIVLLALTYASWQIVNAAPLSVSGEQLDAITTSESTCICSDTHNQRSLLNIIWSCLATIFACTWIAVHPNVPGPDDTWWMITRTRIKTMIYALLAPELVICWAMRQRVEARKISTYYRDQGWTLSHGFFIQMGGFMLFEDGKASKFLQGDELERLHREGKIEFPSITEKEIADRSKGDLVSKSLVLLQTTWFVVQSIARGVQKTTALSELEVMTLAFAVLNIVTYFVWWEKPLDVRCAVPVYLRKLETSDKHATPVQITTEEALNIPSETTASDDNIDTEVDEEPMLVEKSVVPQCPQSLEASVKGTAIPSDVVEIHIEPLKDTSDTITVRYPVVDAELVQYNEELVDPGHLKRPVLIGTCFSGCFVTMRSRVANTVHLTTSWILTKFMEYLGSTEITGLIVDFSDAQIRICIKISIFSSTEVEEEQTTVTIYARSAALAAIFGAIHCIAWSSAFPSIPEQFLWRISSVLITAAPAVLSALIILVVAIDIGQWTVIRFIAYTATYLYFTARIVLLVQVCICLRTLPQSVYEDIAWTSFVPHL